MNRRRPWHHRLLRFATRHAPIRAAMRPAPLVIMSVFNLFGCVVALLTGFLAIALVLVASGLGGFICQIRQQSGHSI